MINTTRIDKLEDRMKQIVIAADADYEEVAISVFSETDKTVSVGELVPKVFQKESPLKPEIRDVGHTLILSVPAAEEFLSALTHAIRKAKHGGNYGDRENCKECAGNCTLYI